MGPRIQTLRLKRASDSEWVTDGLTDLRRLRGTVTLSLDDRALLLSSPALPAFSTTQPEHVLGPETNTDVILKLTIQHLTEVKYDMKSNDVSKGFVTQGKLRYVSLTRENTGSDFKMYQQLQFTHLPLTASSIQL